MKNLFFLAFFLCCYLAGISQFSRQTITNFTSKDYGIQYSNYIYSVVQDSSGYIYAGTTYGILQYDGYKWNFIPVKTGSSVTSLACYHNTIYVGCDGDFGYLQANETGKWQYVSLANKLTNEERSFSTILKIVLIHDTVFFQTDEKIFIYHKKSIHIIKPQTSFHLGFYGNNGFLVRERQKGLEKYTSEGFRFIENSEQFADTGVFAVLPFAGNSWLFITQEAGIFKWQNKKFTPLLNRAQIKLFSDAMLIGAKPLSDGNIAVYTMKQGVYILNSSLSIIAQYSIAQGLRSAEIHDLMQDNYGNIWVATQKGISRIQYASPVSFFNEHSGISGNVQSVKHINDTYYAATTDGLFALNTKTSDFFAEINGIKGSIWSLETDGNSLWACGDNGLWQIQENGTIHLINKEPFSALLYLQETHLIVAAGISGCFIYDENLGKLQTSFPEIKTDAYGMAYQKQKDGTYEIWIGSKSQGVCQIMLDKTNHAKTDFFKGTNDGLPNEWACPYRNGDNVLFGTATGFLRFISSDEIQKLSGTNSSNPVRGYFDVLNYPKNIQGKSVTAFYSDSGKAYIALEYFVYCVGKDSIATNYLFKTIDIGRYNFINKMNQFLWIGGDEGIAVVNLPETEKLQHSKPTCNIRAISILGDSTLWYGDVPFTQNEITLSYQFNSIQIELSSLYIDNAYKLQYSWKLEGSEQENFSAWSNNPVFELNNLKEGTYTLHIKAKDAQDVTSDEITLKIHILPPWYRSWWAFIMYVLSGIGLLYLLVYLNSRRLIAKNKKLEEIVKIRTQEVVQQKEEIKIQKEHIEVVHKEITDSINYAERIQRSFLATESLLNEHLKEYFIFYKPKDVVSGDFYWVGKLQNGHFALTVADSTGHGVPGAFMSILNITSIEKAVEQGLCEPNEILNETRKTIIERLKKDGSPEGGKDGMDASLISFDFSKNTFSYAAANNPVWVIRENNLIELLPDKMPVGKHERDTVSFTRHDFIWQKGDVIYLFSDGFADQFGGPDNKKFKSKQLKELLVSIANMPMPEQLKKLEIVFETWKGDREQVDDVTMLGIRI